jgi:hypothetical protein
MRASARKKDIERFCQLWAWKSAVFIHLRSLPRQRCLAIRATFEGGHRSPVGGFLQSLVGLPIVAKRRIVGLGVQESGVQESGVQESLARDPTKNRSRVIHKASLSHRRAVQTPSRTAVQ